jgi:hypothetical protein
MFLILSMVISLQNVDTVSVTLGQHLDLLFLSRASSVWRGVFSLAPDKSTSRFMRLHSKLSIRHEGRLGRAGSHAFERTTSL